MKVTLTKVYRSTTDKEGNALMTKAGKPYERVSIKTQEHGEKWLSGFGAESNQGWQEGDELELEIEESGQYLNFKNPRGGNFAGVEQLKTTVGLMQMKIDDIHEIIKKWDKQSDDLTSDGFPVPFND